MQHAAQFLNPAVLCFLCGCIFCTALNTVVESYGEINATQTNTTHITEIHKTQTARNMEGDMYGVARGLTSMWLLDGLVIG